MKVKNKKRVNASSIVKRVFISIGLTLVLFLAMVYSLVFAVAHGPSITLRNTLVNMAMQASATKWVPKLVLSASEVDAIVEGAKPQDIVIDTPPETEGVQRIRIDAEGHMLNLSQLRATPTTRRHRRRSTGQRRSTAYTLRS